MGQFQKKRTFCVPELYTTILGKKKIYKKKQKCESDQRGICNKKRNSQIFMFVSLFIQNGVLFFPLSPSIQKHMSPVRILSKQNKTKKKVNIVT